MKADSPVKIKVYLDTSVISSLFDQRAQDRMNETADFWEKRDRFEVCGSELTREELNDTTDSSQREKLLQTLELITIYLSHN